MNALVPTLVFLPLTAATVLQAFIGLHDVVDVYVNLPTAMVVLIPFGLLACTWLIAALLASQWDRLVRIYEGYPLVHLYRATTRIPFVGAIADLIDVPGKQAHQRARSRLARQAKSDSALELRLHLSYTIHHEELLPTRLGNILRSAELYPYDRYGIDFTVLWTRLAILLPEQIIGEIERLIMRYQLPLVISASSCVLALSSLALAWGGQFWLFLLVFGLACLVSLVSYYLSLQSATHYGVAVRSVFDMHRDKLHEKWPQVMTAELDKSDFNRLRTFILSGALSTADKEELNGSDEDSSHGAKGAAFIRKTYPRFPAIRLPVRLRTWAIALALFVALCAWQFTQTTHITVVTANGPARPFEAIDVTRQEVSLYAAGRRSVATNSSSDGDTLIALRSIDSGEMLQHDDYIKVALRLDVAPAFTLLLPTEPSNRLPLKAGDVISLLFQGTADYESDPRCIESEAGGVERLISAQVLAPPDRAGGWVVGLSSDADLALRCFDSTHVKIVQND